MEGFKGIIYNWSTKIIQLKSIIRAQKVVDMIYELHIILVSLKQIRRNWP